MGQCNQKVKNWKLSYNLIKKAKLVFCTIDSSKSNTITIQESL